MCVRVGKSRRKSNSYPPLTHTSPSLTLTVTFHHPEQSLLHKLHWLDHVIRVGVFSVSVFRARK